MSEQHSDQINPLHDMLIDAQNDAIEACAVLAERWPGAPPNLASAIRTLRRSETLLIADSDHPDFTGIDLRAGPLEVRDGRKPDIAG